MKDLSRNVKLFCNICGNDQFESLDEAFENLKEAPETVRVRCSECGKVFTKAELIEVIVMKDKMPFEYLEPGNSFEENVIVHLGSSRKFKINISWEDEKGNIGSNEQIRDCWEKMNWKIQKKEKLFY